MSNINGFTFFKSYYESLKNLKEKDKKIIINAILEYVFEDKKPQFSGIKYTIWTLIEPHLNTSKHRSNGNSGAPIGNQNALKNKEKADVDDIDEEIIKNQSNNNQKTTNDLLEKKKNKKENKNKNKEWENIYIPTPTLDEIISYGNDKKIDEEYCEKFYNHYEAIGWVNGTGQQIKNWKLVFDNWIKKDGKIKIENELEDMIDEAGFIHKNGRRIL